LAGSFAGYNPGLLVSDGSALLLLLLMRCPRLGDPGAATRRKEIKVSGSLRRSSIVDRR